MKVPSSLTDRAACLRARFSLTRGTVSAWCRAFARGRAAARLARFARTCGFALRTGALALARWAGAASALGSRITDLARRAGFGARARRAGIALITASALLAVRFWLIGRALLALRERIAARIGRATRARQVARARSRRLAAQRAGQRSRVRLTGRGGVVVVFATCFLGLLIADWTNWAELADAVFFMASSLTAYYVRPGSLLPVVVSPPLLFFVAIAIEKFALASGTLAALEGTLAEAAPWLFAGTALTVAIALTRGLRREVRALVLELRGL